MYISTIIIGILTSLAAGYFLAIFPLGKIDKIFPFKKLNRIGIIKLFSNQEKAIKTILGDCRKAKFVYLLAVKGETFSDPTSMLHEILKNKNIEQKYLISAFDNPYLRKRSEELKMDILPALEQSEKNIINAQKENPYVFLRHHKEVVRFRIILLDGYIYLSFQDKGRAGKETPVLKIKKGSPIYNNFYSLFSDLWEKYKNT